MNSLKLVRNNFALLFLAVLAVSGIAFLVWAIGANVNCIGTTCNSTNGRSTATGGTRDANSTTGVFTNDNDTASIECAGGTYEGGGGNDTFYLRDPADATLLTPVTIQGQDGDDVILDGCTTNNTLEGGNGNDFIVGGPDDTTLDGGNGNDLLAGGQGNDNLPFAPDLGNDVFIGGPGLDTYNTSSPDGDDIVIIHAGDVPAGNNNEQYICQGNDTILMFGFNTDLVLELTDTTTDQLFGFQGVTSITGECDPSTQGDVCFADPVNNSTGAGNGARYRFSAPSAGNTCTIIVVE